MKSGFTRGLFVGAVVGSVASILVDPNSREKAKDLISQGGRKLRRAGEEMDAAENIIEESRVMLCDEDTMNTGDLGDASLAQKMATLEKRLEELELKRV